MARAVGMEIAMMLLERIEPVERVKILAYRRGPASLSAASFHAVIPILES